mmetsp:Transcript_22585/g.59661  ORF Transcript_22585/g.59661 Transcript_22585/m.59661 type:complete len:182 (+) Transcript_22585:54-599(+)
MASGWTPPGRSALRSSSVPHLREARARGASGRYPSWGSGEHPQPRLEGIRDAWVQVSQAPFSPLKMGRLAPLAVSRREGGRAQDPSKLTILGTSPPASRVVRSLPQSEKFDRQLEQFLQETTEFPRAVAVQIFHEYPQARRLQERRECRDRVKEAESARRFEKMGGGGKSPTGRRRSCRPR